MKNGREASIGIVKALKSLSLSEKLYINVKYK